MNIESTESNNEFDPLISINVVYIDYSMFYKPGSSSEIKDDGIIELIDSPAPVVRIFGSTCSEKRACVHIHGVSLITCRNICQGVAILLSHLSYWLLSYSLHYSPSVFLTLFFHSTIQCNAMNRLSHTCTFDLKIYWTSPSTQRRRSRGAICLRIE